MATVFEAEQISLRRRVALKLLHPHLGLSERSVTRFRREAEACGRHSHPGIVSIYSTGEKDGLHYLAEELVEGGRTLADLIAEHSPADRTRPGRFRDVAALVLQVAEALARAHASGVIHRDVKPSNVLITADGRPKVSDFGLARIEDAPALSRSGDLTGTPYYMSPEQVMGKRSAITVRTDVYSLGVTLYELLTRSCPFSGESTEEVLHEILLHDPPDPTRLDARIPRDLAVVCMKAMERDPRRRYATMAELADDLRRFHDGEAVLARPIGSVRRGVRWVRRHRTLATGAVGGLLLAIALAALGVSHMSRRAERWRLAEESYRDMQEVCAYREDVPGSDPGWYCTRIDPDDPTGHVLTGILRQFLHGTPDLGAALDSYEKALGLCRSAGDAVLENDVRYLAWCAIEELARTVPEGDLAEWRATFGEEWSTPLEFDPTADPPPFVWRPMVRGGSGGGNDVDEPIRPRIREDHVLTKTYRGAMLFSLLYRGGRRAEFEEALDVLDKVLQRDEHSAVAHTLLGRVLFFFTRTHGFVGCLSGAKAHLQHAIDARGAGRNELALTTLGQIALYEGRLVEARDYFQSALTVPSSDACIRQNVHRGLGLVCLRQGLRTEAEEHLLAAVDDCRSDEHTHISLAEFYFDVDVQRALEHASMAHRRVHGQRRGMVSGIAEAYLCRARALLAAGSFDEANIMLGDIRDADNNPHAVGQACRLIATLPGARIDRDSLSRHAVATIDWARVVFRLCRNEYEGEVSAVVLSGLGTAEYRRGLHRDAIDHLNEAIEIRSKWPPELRETYWAESNADRYFLALSRWGLSERAKDPGEKTRLQDAAFEEWLDAESEALAKGPPMEYADIHERVRDFARRTFEGQ